MISSSPNPVYAALNELRRLDTQLLHAHGDVFPAHCGGKRLVLEFLAYGFRLERFDPIRANLAAGNDEAAELVAGEEMFCHGGVALNSRIQGMSKYGIDDLLIDVASLPQVSPHPRMDVLQRWGASRSHNHGAGRQ